ncbi:MAG: hypothetical protein KDK99_16010 [Verrucomicrobiales bacterium]|nr:hypothetical protein [Verrucomicrobiales bacterium]
MIWILTAGFGDGHNTAARSIEEALRRLRPELPVLCEDFFLRTQPRLTRVLQSAYQVAITHTPWAWLWAFNQLAKPGASDQAESFNRHLRRALAQQLDEHQPRLIVSTYPFFSTLLAPLRAERPVPPLLTVITDSVSVHPTWLNDPSDAYAVADEETRAVLLERGIDPARIFVTGFPVSPDFAAALEPPRPADDPARLLYLPSTPGRHVAATLRALRPLVLEGRARLTLPAGKHLRRLYHPLRAFADSVPPERFEIIGWTREMPRLLRTHDAVICKAGGAILHEVLAARTPAIIDYVVPGQEEGNADMLLSHHCALRSHSPSETAECAEKMIAESCRLAREMQGRMIPPLSVPDAAFATARLALQHLV